MLLPPDRAWLLVSGAVIVCSGTLIWAVWPALRIWVIGMFVATDMVFSRTWLIMLAWHHGFPQLLAMLKAGRPRQGPLRIGWPTV